MARSAAPPPISPGMWRSLTPLQVHNRLPPTECQNRDVHIARARAAIAGAGIGDRADVFVGVMQELPFPDGHFDFVWCRDVVEQVDEVAAAIRETARVLRPGGRMLVYTTFATDRLTTEDAQLLNRHLCTVPANL